MGQTTQIFKRWQACSQCYRQFLGYAQHDICPECGKELARARTRKAYAIRFALNWQVVEADDLRSGSAFNTESTMMLVSLGYLEGAKLREEATGLVFEVRGNRLRGTDAPGRESEPRLWERQVQVTSKFGVKGIQDWSKQPMRLRR